MACPGEHDDRRSRNSQGELKTCYGRCNSIPQCYNASSYLSQAHVGISEAVESSSRHMAKPTEASMVQVRLLAWYLEGKPICVLVCNRQDAATSHLRAHTDSDLATELINRKATNGMVLRRILHLIRHSSAMRTSTSVSSAEAEYYAMTKAAASALGLRRMSRDKRIECKIELYCDSSRARHLFNAEV